MAVIGLAKGGPYRAKIQVDTQITKIAFLPPINTHLHSVSVALATILVNFSRKLVLLTAPRSPPLTSDSCGRYRPVPREMMHWMGVDLPHSSLASCTAMAHGLLVNNPPS